MGTKARCYQELPWGTYWEPIGNLKGTCWDQMKNEKHPPSPPPKLTKEKNQGTLRMHAEPSHWLHEISISKTVGHPSFGLG